MLITNLHPAHEPNELARARAKPTFFSRFVNEVCHPARRPALYPTNPAHLFSRHVGQPRLSRRLTASSALSSNARSMDAWRFHCLPGCTQHAACAHKRGPLRSLFSHGSCSPHVHTATPPGRTVKSVDASTVDLRPAEERWPKSGNASTPPPPHIMHDRFSSNFAAQLQVIKLRHGKHVNDQTCPVQTCMHKKRSA